MVSSDINVTSINISTWYCHIISNEPSTIWVDFEFNFSSNISKVFSEPDAVVFWLPSLWHCELHSCEVNTISSEMKLIFVSSDEWSGPSATWITNKLLTYLGVSCGIKHIEGLVVSILSEIGVIEVQDSKWLESKRTWWLLSMPGNSSNLYSVITEDGIPVCLIVFTLRYIVMLEVSSGPWFCSLTSDWTILIKVNTSKWSLEVEDSFDVLTKGDVLWTDCSSSRVCGCATEAMRARTQWCSSIPMPVMEPWVFNSKILSSWSNQSLWWRTFKNSICVIGLTNHESTVNSGSVVSKVISKLELNTCKDMIGSLEVMESYITNLHSNNTISSILPTGKIIHMSCNSRISPERISLVVCKIVTVVLNRFTWIFTWDHVMEDTETIPTNWVYVIVSKFSHSFILRAHISVCMWTNSMNLKIIPVAISIWASCVIIYEIVVRIGDPEACWSLISIQ